MPVQARKVKPTPNIEPKTPAPAPGTAKQRIIAVVSGKGGVGKTNLTVNLGIALTRFGHRVMLVDADFGMANLDLLLGLTPRYNLTHVFAGKKEIDDVVVTGPSGIRILPGGSGGSGGRSAAAVTHNARVRLFDHIRQSPDMADLVFVDTGAEITDNALDLLGLVDEFLLVTTPEPTSIMDAYGIIKRLAQERESALVRLLVNMAEDQYDAQHVMNTMSLISKQFFNVAIEELGWVYHDMNVSRAVRQQQPFLLLFPTSRAARSLNRIAMRFANVPVTSAEDRGFVRRLLGRFM
jgi:flagellar biosynthesis protein FlhG